VPRIVRSCPSDRATRTRPSPDSGWCTHHGKRASHRGVYGTPCPDTPRSSSSSGRPTMPVVGVEPLKLSSKPPLELGVARAHVGRRGRSPSSTRGRGCAGCAGQGLRPLRRGPMALLLLSFRTVQSPAAPVGSTNPLPGATALARGLPCRCRRGGRRYVRPRAFREVVAPSGRSGARSSAPRLSRLVVGDSR